MNKPMTAAAYRQNAAKQREQAPTEIVTLNSGSVFELRRPDLQAWLVTGRVPQSLLNVGLKAWRSQGKADTESLLKAGMKPEEITDALVFMRELVHQSTVNPKFVEFATNDNEISASDMLIEDFNDIVAWAMGQQGVTGLDGLKSFRNRRTRRTAGAKSRGQKLQPASI